MGTSPREKHIMYRETDIQKEVKQAKRQWMDTFKSSRGGDGGQAVTETFNMHLNGQQKYHSQK